MDAEGPMLERLTHRLSECPEDFFASGVDVGALVADLHRAMGAVPSPSAPMTAEPRHREAAAVAVWLLRDDWFAGKKELAGKLGEVLMGRVKALAAVVEPRTLVTDAERREELARGCLAGLGLRPAGETKEQAADRLTALDSVEREKVMKATRDAEARAREVREQMAKRAAEEAAAKATRE